MGRGLGSRAYMLPSAFCEWQEGYKFSAKSAGYVLGVSQASVLNYRSGASPVSWGAFVMIKTVDALVALKQNGLSEDFPWEMFPLWSALWGRMQEVKGRRAHRGRPRRSKAA